MEPPPPPPPGTDPGRDAPNAQRRITRSSRDRMVAGVAGGIAEHYGFDPALVRLAIATLGVVTFGVACAAYVIAWIVIPQDDGRLVADEIRSEVDRHRRPLDSTDRRRGRRWAGITVFVIGLLALSDISDAWPSRLLGPLALIAIGVAVLVSGRSNTDGSSTSTAATTAADPTSAGTTAQPTPSAFPSAPWPTTAHVPPVPPVPPIGSYRVSEHHTAEHRAERRARRRERSLLRRMTLSILAMFAGTAWLLHLTGAVTVAPSFVLAGMLTIVGVALCIGAWFGRSRGLIALAIVLTVVCAITTTVRVPLHGGVGDRTYRPRSSTEIPAQYKLGVGNLVVDLDYVSGTDPLTINARAGLAQIHIGVPDDADVTVHASADLGEIVLFGKGRNDGGWHERRTVHSEGSGRSIDITAHVGIGEIIVDRGTDANMNQRTTGAVR